MTRSPAELDRRDAVESDRVPDAADVVIIGAGPAGTAAAAVLADAGIDCCILERSVFPRFVIGESLIPHCMDLLEEVGFLDAVERVGFVRKPGATFLRGDDEAVFDFATSRTGGWSYTYQVERADFDALLADEVRSRGVPVCFGQTVTGVELDVLDGERHVVTTTSDAHGQSRVSTRFVIDASGYGRVLPRLFELDRPLDVPTRAALFTHVDGDRRPPGPCGGHVWIACADEGAWLWVIPLRHGRASVGAVASPEWFDQFPGSPRARARAVFAAEPNVAARVGDLELVFEPRYVPSFSVGVQRRHGPGWCLVGNSPDFLDPVLSSGVMLALTSAITGARCVAREIAGETVDWESDFDREVQQGIDVFRALVDHWYAGRLQTLFFSESPPTGVREALVSVLAGYAWDRRNPFVRAPQRFVRTIVDTIRAERADGQSEVVRVDAPENQ